MKARTRVSAFIAACALAIATACADGQALLAKVALNESDLGHGVRLETIPGGDSVRVQATLDFCGAEFPSESRRDARLQQSAIDTDMADLVDRGGFMVESVVYDDAAGGAQAFDELRHAIESCPDQFVQPKLADTPLVKYQTKPISDDALGRVAPDHVALYATIWEQSGDSRKVALVYQRRGRALVGLYAPELAAIEPLIPIVAARLAALTPAEAGE